MSRINRVVFLSLLFAIGTLVAISVLVFGGFLPVYFKREAPKEAYGPPTIIFEQTSFSEISGWRTDTLEDALPAFIKSCEAIITQAPSNAANKLENLGADRSSISLSGDIADWMPACRDGMRLTELHYSDKKAWRDAVRAFFESRFTPIKISQRRAPLTDGPAQGLPERIENRGLVTGYYEPAFPISLEKTEFYSAPVLTRPDDLVDVNLGAFRPDLAGERIAGRIVDGRLIPYPDRRAINDGALSIKAETLGYMDPNDLFFLQIQGSGRVIFNDGSIMRVGYDGANGRPYTAIGKVMVDREIMPLSDVSMQSIRNWLETASPAAAEELREKNASYVFFQRRDDLGEMAGPLGAQGVPLTAQRSIAVDRRFYAMGTPIFVDIEASAGVSDTPLRQLMIAQDTGGAIRGPIRGDYFWGAGEDASSRAGMMKASVQFHVLLPRDVASKALTAQGS